jgi:hypothetical protein
MRAHPPLRRLIACILLPCYLLACTTWQTQELTPEQVIAQEQPEQVLVKLADGSKVVLAQPRVSGDTLSGFDGTEPYRVPLADVSAIELKESDSGLTVLFIAGTVVVVAALTVGIAAIIICGGPSDPC